MMKFALLRMRGVVVTNVRYHLDGMPERMMASSPALDRQHPQSSARMRGHHAGGG
jgi:hypothetical protein